ENFTRRRAEAEMNFANALVRQPAHSGSGYPDEPVELRKTLEDYLKGEAPNGRIHAVDPRDTLSGNSMERAPRSNTLIGIAAPHVSPFGGVEAYRAAYSELAGEDPGRTFVILGTSHYGRPDKFGLTRKPFLTPYGETVPALDLVDELERTAPDSVSMEDYCHAI